MEARIERWEIATVWLVSGSPFVRLGAMLMGKALSIEIKSVASPERIVA